MSIFLDWLNISFFINIYMWRQKMNYIYDILLNFNSELYDFFEWNLNDNIINIRKIPIYKVNSKTLLDFKDYYTKVDSSFLGKLKNKTEVFTNRDVDILEYASLFTDGSSVIAIQFNDEGYICKKSSLLVDEDLDVLEISNRVKEIELSYECLHKEFHDPFKTRQEQQMIMYIRKEFEKCREEKKYDKLKYLYFECFAQDEDSIDKIISKIENNFVEASFVKKIYDFFKLTSIQK